MSNGATFVSTHCWANNVCQFDLSLRIKALVLTLTRIIRSLKIVSERVAIYILVSERAAIYVLAQTGIHFSYRLFTFFEGFEKKRSQLGLYCRVKGAQQRVHMPHWMTIAIFS